MDANLIRLQAYLDQEACEISKIWQDTSSEAKQEFLEWAGSDSPSQQEPEPAWIDFAARLALFFLQSQIAKKD